jgi:hypothetical protein
MPCFIVSLLDFNCFFTIFDTFFVISRSQLRLLNSHLILIEKLLIVSMFAQIIFAANQMIQLNLFQLLIFKVKYPFGQLEITFTQYLLIVNLIVENQVLKQLNCSFLLHIIVVVLINRKFHFSYIILDYYCILRRLPCFFLKFYLQILQQVVEHCLTQNVVSLILGKQGKPNVLINFFCLVYNYASNVKTSLKGSKIFGWLNFESFLP